MGTSQEAVTAILKKIAPVSATKDVPGKSEGAFPLESLGRLGMLVRQLRAIRPDTFDAKDDAGSPLRKLLLVAAADHGAGAHGISHYPQETTKDLLADALAGRAAIARLAPRRQVRAVLVDVGVADDATYDQSGWAEFDKRRVADGSKDISKGPAMDRDQAVETIATGIQCFEHWSSGWNVDLLGIGDLGIGSSIAACALAATVTEHPVDELTGNDAVPGRTTRSSLVAWAVERVSPPDPHDAIGLLAEYGGLEIGALAGACLAAAAANVPILLDGATSTAAAAIAGTLAPACRDYFIASHRASLPAHGALLEYLGLEPLLQLDLDLGEGVGAVLAMDLVEAALELGQK